MFPKHLKRHGHGPGPGHHKKMHRSGGRHEKFEHHFKHPGHHMGREFFIKIHHRGLDFERGCFSESELPDTTTPNVTGDQNAGGCNLPREFFERRRHWKHGRCCCEKNDKPATTAETMETGEKNDVSANAATENVDAGEKTNVPATETQNVEGQNNTKVCCRMGWHCFRHHGGRRFEFNRPCPRCTPKNDDTTDNEATTEGEKEGDDKEGYVRKQYRGHHKGKRGHGFRKPCRQCLPEDSATENEDISDREGVRHGYIRKHHHGHHGGRRGGMFEDWHHRDRRGGMDEDRHHRGRRGGMFEERHHGGRRGGMFEERHHGGKWGHGPYKMHHREWRRHGCCIIMVDAAVNTDGPVSEENVTQEVSGQENSHYAAQNMEQGANEEVSQGQAESENVDQVLEVADNLRKSSLE